MRGAICIKSVILGNTTLRLSQRKLWSRFFVLARKDPADVLAARLRPCGFTSLVFGQTDLVKSQI